MSEKKEISIWERNIIKKRSESSTNKRIFGEFNKIFIRGIIESEFEYSHEVYSQKFYKTRVIVRRTSGTEDFIPIVISENLLNSKMSNKPFANKWVEIAGEFRSHNITDQNDCRHLNMFLFVKEFNVYNDEKQYSNLVYLDGFICQPPVVGETLLGIKVTNLCIAVNRNFRKSDYIQCITWDDLAKYSSCFEVGDHVRIYGKVRSRKYFKKYSIESDEGEYKIAYEVSIKELKKV